MVESRYRFVVGPLLVDARKRVPWVEGKRLKDELDAQILRLLGPKTVEDNEKPVKKVMLFLKGLTQFAAGSDTKCE